MLEGLFFLSSVAVPPSALWWSCMSNPLLHYTDFIKFTKIKARLALNIPQKIGMRYLHEIGLIYIIAIWWNSGGSGGILISCCRRAHTSVFQGNLGNLLSDKETVWLLYFEWHVKPRSNNVIKSEQKWQAINFLHSTNTARQNTFAHFVRHIDS